MYEYQARVRRVIDGDTVDVRIDLGFSVFHEVRLRLAGIDAPEMRGAQRELGRAAQLALLGMIVGKDLVVRTEKDSTDKYGRYVATIFADNGVNINERMITIGHATRYAA